MEHQAAQELFSDYLEGTLSEAERGALAAHLEGCADCRAELETLRQMLRSLSGLRTLPPPDNFSRKVEQRIARRSRGRFFGHERVLMRLPFEWISFVIIILMLAVYMILVQGQVKKVRPGPGSGGPGSGSGTSLPMPRSPPKR